MILFLSKILHLILIFLSRIFILNIKILPLTSVEMIARDDGFVRPAEGDQCWFDMNCTLADNSIYKKDIFGYTVFEIQD